MKTATLKKIGRGLSVLLAVVMAFSVCTVAFAETFSNISAGTLVSSYVCNFENGSYGTASSKANTGSVVTDESGNSYFRFEVPTDADTYCLEVYNSASGELVLKDGSFYCVTLSYKIENIADVKEAELGTSINIGRHSGTKGAFLKIKGMAGVNYMPGDTTDWITQSVIFKASLSSSADANKLAVNISSPTCGSTASTEEALSTVVLVDDITVHECVGTTAAIDFSSNGGSYCAPVMAQPGEAVDLPTPERELYKFAGWFTDPQLTKPFASASMPKTLVTKLYAKWNISDSAITVAFDSMGGEAVAPLAGAKQGDPLTLPTTTRVGFNFAGWYNSDFTERYSVSRFPADDMTLYAKWEPIPAFCGFENKDKFDAPNNGSFSLRCLITSDDPKSGMNSLYYDYEMGTPSDYTAWAGVQLIDEYGQKYMTENGQKYKLTFKYKVVEVTKAGTIGIRLSSASSCWTNPVALNKKDLGDSWISYDSSDIGKGWQEASIIFTSRFGAANAGCVAIGIGGHAKLYVDDITVSCYDERFLVSDKCMLAFDTNGGEFIETLYGSYGETITVPTPVREGYTFVGWFSDAACRTEYHSGTFQYRFTKIYADWKKVEEKTDKPVTGTTGGNTPTAGDSEAEAESNMTVIIIVVAAVVVVIVVAVAVVLLLKKKKTAESTAKPVADKVNENSESGDSDTESSENEE